MVFYTELKEYEDIEPTLEGAPPSLWEYVGAVSQDMWNSNPTTSAIRAYELSQSIVGSYDIDDSGGGLPSITHTPPKTRELSLDEQAAHIKRLGLEGMVKPTQGYTQEAFDIVTSRKFEENAIKETRESAPMRYAPLGLAAGLGVALADPVNIFRVDPRVDSSDGVRLHTAHALARVEMDGETHIAHVVFKESAGFGSDKSRRQWNYYGHKIKNTDTSGDRAWLNELVPSTEVSVFKTSLYDALKSVKNRGSRIPESVDFMYQEGVPQALDADAAVKLREEAAAWGNTVDAIAAAGKKPSDSPCMLTQTPLILHLLGAEFRELHAAPHMFDGLFPEKTRNPRHNAHPNITPEILKQIPQALADPIMVFDSERGGGRLVFMLDVKDAGGATVVVPVELEATGIQKRKINILTSAFAKEREGVADNAWFVRQAQKNLRYINEGKTKRWSRSSWVQFPFVRLSNAPEKTVFTEADLVNLRRKHPGLYQEGNRKAAALVEQKSGAAPRAGGDSRLPTASKGNELREYAALSDKNLNLTEATVCARFFST